MDTQTEDTDSSNMINLELEQLLIHELLIQVVRYFCKVHLNEQVTKLKDYILEVSKTYQHRHTVDSVQSKSSAKPNTDFPCGICGQECIEILHESEASIEQFSVQCDQCKKWFHYPCMQLNGNEPELQENSELPFYCTQCGNNSEKEMNSNITQQDSTNEVGNPSSETCSAKNSASKFQKSQNQVFKRGRGRGRGRGRSRVKSGCNVQNRSEQDACVTNLRDPCTPLQTNEDAKSTHDQTTSVSRSGRIRKSVTKLNL